jgi:hypothetical protein
MENKIIRFIAKVKDKNLFLNKSSWGLPGEETTFYAISKTPELFDGREDLKETLDFFKSGFGKIVNDIDDSDVKDLVIKKIEFNVF